MTAKSYEEKKTILEGYLRASRDLEVIRQQYEDLETIATHITPTMDDMPHGSGVTDKVGSIATLMADLREQIAHDSINAIAEMAKVEQAINQLHGTDRKLMYLYYIKGRTWEEVAEEVGYNPYYIMDVRRNIIEHMSL